MTSSTTGSDGQQLAPAHSGLVTFGVMVRHGVLDRWVLPAVVGALMIAMGLLTGALWPSLEATLRDLPGSFNDNIGKALAGADLTTGAGWANTEFVTLVAPMGIIAVAVLAAVRALPGEERSKTMGVVLAAPVSRSAFLLAKLTAVLLQVTFVAATVGVGLALGNVVGGLGLNASGIVGASVHLALLGAAFGAVGIAAGGANPNRQVALGIAAGSAAVAFVMSVVLPLLSAVDELARLSPWYYFSSSEPLTQGADVAHLAVLGGLTVVLSLAGLRFFNRRDLEG